MKLFKTSMTQHYYWTNVDKKQQSIQTVFELVDDTLDKLYAKMAENKIIREYHNTDSGQSISFSVIEEIDVIANHVVDYDKIYNTLQYKLFLVSQKKQQHDKETFIEQAMKKLEASNAPKELLNSIKKHQEPLGSEFQQVLDDNRWDLYE